MKKRLNPAEIKEIVYNYEDGIMKIFNKSNHLIYNEVVSEGFFKKTVSKFSEELEKIK